MFPKSIKNNLRRNFLKNKLSIIIKLKNGLIIIILNFLYNNNNKKNKKIFR